MTETTLLQAFGEREFPLGKVNIPTPSTLLRAGFCRKERGKHGAPGVADECVRRYVDNI